MMVLPTTVPDKPESRPRLISTCWPFFARNTGATSLSLVEGEVRSPIEVIPPGRLVGMATKSSPEELAMLTAKVPADFMAAITAEAARRGVSRSQAVREALAAWLDTEAVPA